MATISRSLVMAGKGAAAAAGGILSVVFASACPVCSDPLGPHRGGICACCRDEALCRPVVGRITTLGPYEGRLRSIIGCLKFRGLWEAGHYLGEEIASLLLTTQRDMDVVIPVPLHPVRKWHRGYNQAELMSERIARAIGRPHLRNLLRRRRATPTQTGGSRLSRMANVKRAFSSGVQSLNGAVVLLVDDVVTTGATVRECARVLRASGASRVDVAAAARTLPTK